MYAKIAGILRVARATRSQCVAEGGHGFTALQCEPTLRQLSFRLGTRGRGAAADFQRYQYRKERRVGRGRCQHGAVARQQAG